MLELNSFAFQLPCHLFRIWILRLAQHRPVSTLRSNPHKREGKGWKSFSSLSLCPMAVTQPLLPPQLPISISPSRCPAELAVCVRAPLTLDERRVPVLPVPDLQVVVLAVALRVGGLQPEALAKVHLHVKSGYICQLNPTNIGVATGHAHSRWPHWRQLAMRRESTFGVARRFSCH